MKYKIIFCCAILFSSSMKTFVKAQSNHLNCEFEINETDEFTKEKILQTKTFEIINENVKNGIATLRWTVKLKFRLRNEKIFMGLEIFTKSAVSKIISPFPTAMSSGDIVVPQIVYLLLSDQSVIKLLIGAPEAEVKVTGVWVTGTSFYELSEENFDKILKTKIVKMRLQEGQISTGVDADFLIKDNDAIKIIADATCIKNSLPPAAHQDEEAESKLNKTETVVKEKEAAATEKIPEQKAEPEAAKKEAQPNNDMLKENSEQLNMPQQYIINYGLLNMKDSAIKLVDDLRTKGYDANYYWIPDKEKETISMYRVYIGPFNSQNEANSIFQKIKKLQSSASIMPALTVK